MRLLIMIKKNLGKQINLSLVSQNKSKYKVKYFQEYTPKVTGVSKRKSHFERGS